MSRNELSPRVISSVKLINVSKNQIGMYLVSYKVIDLLQKGYVCNLIDT